MKYDSNNDLAHDQINTGDKIWYLSSDVKYLAIVLEVKNESYIIAYYDKIWETVQTTYDKIFPRIRDERLPNVFEIYDTVLINLENSQTFGVVIGYELGLNVILKYAGKIFRRVILPSSLLSHHEQSYDEILFGNRKILLDKETWVKWDLPKM